MSIRPIMDMNNVYLRMGEVSREQDKEIKKEEREQSFQKRIRKFREENFDHTVSRVRESHADQTVKEHEDRNLPEQKKHKDDSQPQEQLSALELALPMLTLNEHSHTHQPLNLTRHPLDPDLGNYVNIES